MASNEFFKDLEIHRANGNVVELYNKYADEYDDTLGQVGYATVQEHVSKCLKARLLDEQQQANSLYVLDIGCGTGTSGEHLKKVGFINIDGSDPSERSLEVSRSKNIYRNLFSGLITDKEKLPCADDSYDGVACIGCVAKSHIEMKPAIDEFTRIVKPGGFVACTINARTLGVGVMMSVLSAAMENKQIDLLVLEQKKYFGSESCFCCAFRVL